MITVRLAGGMMTNTAARFFGDLEAQGHHALLVKATGTLEFDLSDGDQVETWVLALDHGNIAVSRDPIDPTCRVRSSTKLFDGVTSGRVNAMAAMLRGELVCEGDAELLMLFQRILPGPGDARSMN
jgi:putative sterol carrier protein